MTAVPTRLPPPPSRQPAARPEPAPGLLKGNPAYRLLLSSFWEQRRLVATVLVLSLVTAVLEGGTFALLGLTLEVLVGGREAGLARLPARLATWFTGLSRDGLFVAFVILAVSAQVLRAAASVLAGVLNTLLAAKVQKRVQQALYHEILRFSFPCAARYPVGDLTNYVVTPVARINYLLYNTLSTVSTSLTIAAYVVVLCYLSIPLFLAALVLFGTLAWVQKHILKRVHSYAHEVAVATTALSRRLVEALQSLRLIHLFQAQQTVLRRIGDSQDGVIAATMRMSRRTALISPLSDSVVTLGIGLFLVASYYVFQAGNSDFLPQMLTFMAVLNRMSGRVSTLGGAAAEMMGTLGGFKVVNEVLSDQGKTYLRRGGAPFQGLSDAIVFDHVTLLYQDREVPALHAVSFRMPRGTTTALVGPSGAGKSSLADLLVGLYEPTGGRILIDGQDLAELDLGSWRARLGVVSQDTILVNDTIRENIRFARPQATDAEVVQAARDANAAEFIEALPAGYDTIIGERGFMLSGGQRQRLALARALLRRPEVLILDEATSALDGQSERAIQETLRNYHHTCTQLVIAHRLATVREADQIVVLDGGVVVEMGSHDELLARNGRYARLWETQDHDFDPRPD